MLHRGKSTTGLAGSLLHTSGESQLSAVADENSQDPGVRAAVGDTIRKFALSCTLVFIYFRFSFLHEFIASRYGIDTHALLILGALSCLAILMSGRPFVAFKYKSGRMWLFFVACMCLATVFSSWRGGSINILMVYLRTVFPLILLIPAAALTAKDIQKVITTIGLAGATAILLGISTDFRAGRIGMDVAGGTISDPNDFAAHLILVVPAVVYWTMRRGRGVFMKLLGIALLAGGLYEFLSTGSRGGFIGLICMGVYVLMKGSVKLRLGLILGIPILWAFALPFAPASSVHRITSVFDSGEEDEGAAESREARRFLLQESLRITFHHPLLGVGPGEFADFQGGLAAEKGERGAWHDTHNTYTQASSECGIPAAIFFLSAMFLTYRSLRKAKKADVKPISPIANTLSVMLVGYSSAIFFLSHAYGFPLLVITGLSVSIERLLVNERRSTLNDVVEAERSSRGSVATRL